MKTLNRREKIILWLTIGVITVGMSVQLIVKPLRENSENVADQIEAAQKRLSKSKKLIEEANALQNDYQKLVDILGKASSEGVENSAMVAKLEEAAKAANVHISNMQPRRAVKRDPFLVISVDLTIDGTWSSVTRFLYDVQAQPNLFNIDEMNLEKFSDTASTLRGRLLISRFRVD